ncbi:hypothetical protein AB0C51_13440 [Streptomyces pathocidini]
MIDPETQVTVLIDGHGRTVELRPGTADRPTDSATP